MDRTKKIISAVVVSGGLGLAGQNLFAQAGPGGGSAPAAAGPGSAAPAHPGPTTQQPAPTMPRETHPTIPGQPAPRGPEQRDQVVPAEPRTPGVIGQTDQIIPGQQGTIPERIEPPGSVNRGTATASSDEIKKAQEALRAKGHNPGAMDGTMNSQTQQALRDFQQANKLPVTGVLDRETAAKLGISGGAGSTTPQRGKQSVSPQGSETVVPGKRAVE